jgi:hypothetical protein
MKARILVLSTAVILLCAIPSGVIGQEKYALKANEEIYGTWTNEQYNGNDIYHSPKVVVTPDGYKLYRNVSDSVTIEAGTLGVDSKWTDSEGNIWYKAFGTGTTGDHWQEIDKISRSGTVRETQIRPLGFGQFDPSNYPTEIFPNSSGYRILYRVQK